MKILVYFNSMKPAGGIERVISEHIKFLISNDHEIILVTKNGEDSFYKLPLSVKHESIDIDFDLDMKSKVKRIFKIAFNLLKTTRRLKKKILTINPDIIYVASPLSLLELYLTGGGIKNIIVTEHSSFVSYNRIYKLIIKKLYPKVGLLTTPTTMDTKIYSSLGIENYYLPNPLPFYPKVISRLKNKTALNIGRFTNDKRHDLLVRLWAKSEARNLGWKLNIIGTGENYNNIISLIRDLNANDIIYIDKVKKDIEKEYLKSSLFILTSRNEGFGLVLAEAMACGVPCISYNCPSGPRDIIKNGFNGFLIEETNHDYFLNRLNELMMNEDLRNKLGRQARDDIKKFESNTISEKLNTLLKNKFENYYET